MISLCICREFCIQVHSHGAHVLHSWDNELGLSDGDGIHMPTMLASAAWQGSFTVFATCQSALITCCLFASNLLYSSCSYYKGKEKVVLTYLGFTTAFKSSRAHPLEGMFQLTLNILLLQDLGYCGAVLLSTSWAASFGIPICVHWGSLSSGGACSAVTTGFFTRMYALR